MNIHSFTFKSIIAIAITIGITLIALTSFAHYSKTNLKEQSKEPIYFGSTYMTMNNPYFEVINNEIKTGIEANGDILITLDPALSVSKQKEQIEYLIKQDVQLIFLNAVDLNSLSTELKRCKDNGIIVVAVDTDVKDISNISYTLVSDNYDAGVQAAKDMMKQKESANIVLLEHSSANSAVQRIQGFIDTLDNNKYHIVYRDDTEGQLENATPIIRNILNKNIDFDVVMALNDPSALGALAALQENDHLEGVIVYGVDGTPEAKALIRDHKMRGSVAQSPIQMGRRAVEIAYSILSGDGLENKEILPVKLITIDNIMEYTIEGWQ